MAVLHVTWSLCDTLVGARTTAEAKSPCASAIPTAAAAAAIAMLQEACACLCMVLDAPLPLPTPVPMPPASQQLLRWLQWRGGTLAKTGLVLQGVDNLLKAPGACEESFS